MSLRVHSIPTKLARSYFIESDEGLYLVDTGAPGSEETVLKLMEKLGRDDLRLIYITHAHLDHYGSAAALRRITGAPIAIHRADAERMARGETHLGEIRGWGKLIGAFKKMLEPHMKPEATRPDILLDDGDRLDEWGLDAKVVHIPGHTHGSSCLLVEGRLAFVGDLLSTVGRLHAQRFFAEDWSQIPESLERLKALGVEWVYAGHGRRALSGPGLDKLNVQ
ncbi:MAG: MBL fold metallo-hydrolase [Candidatus Tritonobacter lacicola]|nr:MBL fold metallo-hydrolase [Candidatus Tritonobacter lacicola]